MARTLRVTFTEHKKIHAIKYVRELSGLGLKEAKDTVEGDMPFTTSFDDLRLASFVEAAARDEVYFSFDTPLAVAPNIELPRPSGGEWAVRYHSGTNKIEAIRLARELTGLGLKEAKDLVEQQGVILSGLSRAQAQVLIERFASFGSLAVLEQVGAAGGQVQLPAPTPGRAGTPANYGRSNESDDF